MSQTTAFIRVGNVEHTILPCLESIKNIFDIYAIGYSDNLTDNTLVLIKKYISENNLQNYYLYHYPYTVIPSYDIRYKQKNYSPENSLASYYNFLLSKIDTEFLYKIDCDQIYFSDKLITATTIAKRWMNHNPSISYAIQGFDTRKYCNYILNSKHKKLNGGIDHFFIRTKFAKFIQKDLWESLRLSQQTKWSFYRHPLWFHFKNAQKKPINEYDNIDIKPYFMNSNQIILYEQYVLPLFIKYNSEYKNLVYKIDQSDTPDALPS